jgi:hypothetical protein
MTRDELEFQANRIIAAAKASLELQNELAPIFLLHTVARGWTSYPMPPGTENLLNTGKAKDILFEFFRLGVKDMRCDAVLFATDAWQGEVTEEGLKHYETPAWEENHDFGFVKLQKLGWMKVREAITITVQTESDVLIVMQAYQRLNDCIQLLNCERQWLDQSAFGGRQKMFGDLREENLGSTPKRPQKAE